MREMGIKKNRRFPSGRPARQTARITKPEPDERCCMPRRDLPSACGLTPSVFGQAPILRECQAVSRGAFQESPSFFLARGFGCAMMGPHARVAAEGFPGGS